MKFLLIVVLSFAGRSGLFNRLRKFLFGSGSVLAKLWPHDRALGDHPA